MTTMYNEVVRCAVCGSDSEFAALGSTNRFGSPDLVTRPPEMERSTLFVWIQRCPQCGYCAPDLSEAPNQADQLVNGPAYKRQLSDSRFPKLANTFLCSALIQESSCQYAAAAWAHVHAAWAKN